MSIAYLKVKIKSLAVEATIIRHEERKYGGSWRWLRKQEANPKTTLALSDTMRTWHGLWTHRSELSIEQRAALVAYGYLRGRAYREIETDPHWLKAPFSRQGPDWNRVRDLVWKYGPFQPAGNKKETDSKQKLWDKLMGWRKEPIAKAA